MSDNIEKRISTLEGKSVVVDHVYKAIEAHNKSIKILEVGQAEISVTVKSIDKTLNNGIIGKVNDATSYIKERSSHHNKIEKRKNYLYASLLTALFTGLLSLIIANLDTIIVYFFK